MLHVNHALFIQQSAQFTLVLCNTIEDFVSILFNYLIKNIGKRLIMRFLNKNVTNIHYICDRHAAKHARIEAYMY